MNGKIDVEVLKKRKTDNIQIVFSLESSMLSVEAVFGSEGRLETQMHVGH